MATELVVRARTFNRPGFRYGRYRLWGDLARSRYFSIHQQAPLDPVLRALSLDVTARSIGQAFMGHAAVRRITHSDHALLAMAARALPAEPRARLIPEERLEALAVTLDSAAVERLLLAEAPGLAAERRSYLYETSVSRARQHTDALRARYDDRCQLCLWSGREHYEKPLCEAHHIQWLSRGGADDLDNLVLVCPNHHRAIHASDAAFDFGELAFLFEAERRERLLLPGHLAA